MQLTLIYEYQFVFWKDKAEMKLAEEIIEALSSEQSSLTEALLKTKVLLHQIGYKELVEWVNHELNGYPDADNVPSYRILDAQVMANLNNGLYQITKHPLPTRHLTADQQKSLGHLYMKQSLAVLAKLEAGEHGHLEGHIPLEFNSLLGEGLANGMHIQRAWLQVQTAEISGIFVQVRSRLLDFLLEINPLYSDDSNGQRLNKKIDGIDPPEIFRNAIFGNNANVTIQMGSNNSQTVSVANMRGDLELLLSELRKLKVPETEITQLQTAIERDSAKGDQQQKEFGPNVKSWIDKMISKAADASWQIELNVAAGVLTTKLQAFYGWLT